MGTCHGPRRWILTSTFVYGLRGQGAPEEPFLTALTVGARCVVQATQAVARQGVTVAHGIGVHIPAALALLAGLGGPREPQRVPKKAIITDLTSPPWGENGVCGGAGMRNGSPWGPQRGRVRVNASQRPSLPLVGQSVGSGVRLTCERGPARLSAGCGTSGKPQTQVPCLPSGD